LFQHAALPHDLFLRLYDPEPTEIHTLSLHDALPIFTMLAEHRLVYHGYVLHVIQVPDFIFLRIGLAVLFDRIIPVDTYPMHFPAAAYFITAYNRNIILKVTSYDAGTTARTGIEVYGHYPFVARLLVFVPQIVSFVRVSPPAGIMGRILLVLRETRFADNVS